MPSILPEVPEARWQKRGAANLVLAVDTSEERIDNSLVNTKNGKISWENARPADRDQPL
jgi:hypothetical protein